MKKILEKVNNILESYDSIPKSVKKDIKLKPYNFNNYFTDLYSNNISMGKLQQESMDDDNYKLKALIELIEYEEDITKVSNFLEITTQFNELLGDSEVDLSTQKSLLWNVIKNEGGAARLLLKLKARGLNSIGRHPFPAIPKTRIPLISDATKSKIKKSILKNSIVGGTGATIGIGIKDGIDTKTSNESDPKTKKTKKIKRH